MRSPSALTSHVCCSATRTWHAAAASTDPLPLPLTTPLPAPLNRPVIREDLSLTSVSVGLSGVLATLGAIVGRMGMGTLLDVLGPRYSNAIIMLMFAPPVFLMSMVKGAGGFECVRFFIGISLCCFVTCQFW